MSTRETYGLSKPIHETTKRKPGFRPVDHARPWRDNNPAKKGHNKTINKASYVEDPGRP